VIRSSRRSAGRSRAVVAALVAAGGTMLAGCQTGQQAATAEQIPTIDGNHAQVGSLALRDVTIEYPERGSWAQGSDARLELIVVNQGGETDRLVDVRTDAAAGVALNPGGPGSGSGPGSGEGSASPTVEPSETATPTATASATPTPSASPSGTASESPDESGSATPTPEPTPSEEVEAGIPIPASGLIELRGDGPEILLTGLAQLLRPAQVVPVTFVFAEAGEVTVQVAVAVPLEEIAPAPTVPADPEAEAGE
jgi:copper(I)-binding protein